MQQLFVLFMFAGRRAPAHLHHLLHTVTTKRLPRVAKLLIWLVARVHRVTAGGKGSKEDVALAGLERLGNILEQYYHPSNNGRQDAHLAESRIMCPCAHACMQGNTSMLSQI